MECWFKFYEMLNFDDVNQKSDKLTEQSGVNNYFILIQNWNGVKFNLEILLKRESGTLASASHHTGLLVLSNALLEEVGLALHGNEFHPVEGVLGVENLVATEAGEKTIGDELDVLGHKTGIHTDEFAIKRLADELALNL